LGTDGASQWERNATLDPLWAILTDPAHASNRWTEDEFFETGVVEWQRVSDALRDAGAIPDFEGTFVDFGCGVGRVTRQLQRAFRTGVGVDASPTMVALAEQLNPGGRFLVPEGSALSEVGDASASFAYSHMVLQHMALADQRAAIRELLRVLRPDGIAALQVVVEMVDTRPPWRQMVGRLLGPARRRWFPRRQAQDRVDMTMNLIPDLVMRQVIHACRGEVVAAPYTNSADVGHNGRVRFYGLEEARERVFREPDASPLLSRFYFIRKQGT
jgi:SAM-dependent methyltransferase